MIRNIVFILACLVTLNVQAVKRPNIVLLFADDMGYGDLGCYGHPTIRTPNLDRLAGQGLRLTSFYSAPGCVPARKQLLLGRYPGRVHTNGNTGVTGKGGLSDSELTLAEALTHGGRYSIDRFMVDGRIRRARVSSSGPVGATRKCDMRNSPFGHQS